MLDFVIPSANNIKYLLISWAFLSSCLSSNLHVIIEQSIAGNFPDVASPQKEIEDLSLRAESGFKKVHHLVEISSLSSGFVPETELGKEVIDNWNRNYLPAQHNAKVLKDVHLEGFRNTWNSETRFCIYSKNTNVDYLNIMAVGEVKKQSGENFSNAQIGQAISFGERTTSTSTTAKFCFNPVQYEFVPPQPLLYNSNRSENGWEIPGNNYGKLSSRLGIGERRVLENLSSLESPHIPKILFTTMTPLS
ncbi:unnamed protein product [Rhizophagus irregularis]|nr:unnamed protein product [Rhizophagus irregularis]